MKNQKAPRKLSLAKETLRSLSGAALEMVAGGTRTGTLSCPSQGAECSNGCPTQASVCGCTTNDPTMNC